MEITLSKVQITNGCPAQPGCCAVCGTSTGRFIDFGLFLEFYGVVYICVDGCFRDLANTLGALTEQQSESLQMQNQVFAEKIAQQAEKLAAYEDALRAITVINSDSGAIVESGSAVLNPVSDPEEGEGEGTSLPEPREPLPGSDGEPGGEAPTPAPEPDPGEDPAVQPDDGKRSSSIRDDDSLKRIFGDI